VRRLAEESSATRYSISEALAKQFEESLMFFGPEDDPVIVDLHGRGILDALPDTLRTRFSDRITEMVTASGLTLRGTEALAWSRWDAERRRISN